MPLSHRLLAATATALVLCACQSSGDKATLSISLGSALQSLTLEGVVVTRFELEVACVDGTSEKVSGDVAEDGSFAADVARCPQATLRFRGLTGASRPALAGFTDVIIVQATTDVVIPVRRVGTVSFVNDDTYASVCAIQVASAPEFNTAFRLEPGASVDAVLPVVGSSLACAPADTCGSIDTCDFNGPLAVVRTVAVPFGGASTLSLANLANGLVFSIGPPSPLTAGGVFGRFQVTLVDERGVAISRSDVTVDLVAESPVIHGGFTNGSIPMINGVADFNGVGFTTAGSLVMRARANVDGVLLETEPRTIDVRAGAAALLAMTGPATAIAGTALGLQVNAVDGFGNPTTLPTSIVVSSNDPGAQALVIADLTPPGDVAYVLFTAGPRIIQARSASNSSIAGSLAVAVSAAEAKTLELTGTGANLLALQDTTFTVTARDAFANVDPAYRGTVQLVPTPAGDLVYGGPHTFDAADAGVFTFANVHFTTEGIRDLRARDALLVSAPLSVNVVPAGALDHFEVLPATQSVQAGEAFNVMVNAVDAGGNIVTSFQGPVDVSSPGGCSATFSFTYIEAGTLTLPLSCTLVGTWTLHANYADAHFGDSAPITVAPGAANTVEFVQQPPPTVLVNTPFTVTVQVSDSFGNAVDPRGFSFLLSYNGSAGVNLGGDTLLAYVGNLVSYSSLTLDGADSNGSLSVQVTPPPGELSTTSSNNFNVVPSGGCPIAYVSEGGTNDADPCSPATPAGSIQAAVNLVDDGGRVWVSSGTYVQNVSLAKSVILEGGYATDFNPLNRDPLTQTTTIKAPQDTFAALQLGSGAFVTTEGFVIAAADASSASSFCWAVSVVGGANLTLENNRILGPVSDFGISGVGVVFIGAANDVTIRNNWIHTGGKSSGTALGLRDGIFSASTSGLLRIVHNTIYVASAATAQAVNFSGAGAVQLTNNLIMGDFSTCADQVGVCVVREGSSTISIDSAQHNYVLDASSSASSVYRDRAGVLYATLDKAAVPAFAGNVIDNGDVPAVLLESFAGADGYPETFADNDWHLVARSPTDIGLDATQSLCGGDALQACGGAAEDIDGQLRTAPVCAGADDATVINN